MSYHGPMDQATIYNQQGFQADLPSLNTGRYSHACGHFVNMDMQAVSSASVYPCYVVIMSTVQVYLVAGGYATNHQLASTELLVAGAHSWVEAAPLPLAVEGLRAVSINNMIISTGEEIASSTLS